MTARPLFVFGIARGGTNLLARIVDAHPQAAVALDPFMPVFRFWRDAAMAAASDRLLRAHAPGGPFSDGQFDADGPALLDAVLAADPATPVPADRLAELRALVRERSALEAPALAARMDRLAGETVAALFRSGLAIVAEAATGAGKRDLAWAGAKEVWTADFIPALARALPEARFALIHRDPRAVVMSLLALAARDPTQKAHPVSYMRHWRKQVVLARRFEADPALRGRLFTTTFETLCRAPEPEVLRLCSLLDLPFAPAMLRPGEESGWTGNSSFGRNEEPIDPAAAERWRGRIDPSVRQAVEFHCGPEMRLLGYDVPDDAGALTPLVAQAAFAWHADPGKWRSDSGDPAADLAWEVLRQRVAADPGAGWPAAVLARCMLDGAGPARTGRD